MQRDLVDHSGIVCDSAALKLVRAAIQGEKYGYTEKLTGLTLPDGCSADAVRVSKLYVQVCDSQPCMTASTIAADPPPL